MFVHVPAAWMALLLIASYFCQHCGGGTAPSIGLSGSPRGRTGGRGFTLVALVTGALWGQPMWGTWWVWDARLTSVLVLLFIYLGYIALGRRLTIMAARRAYINFGSCGFVNVPIVKFSVDWWNTLHQPASVSRFARLPCMPIFFIRFW